MTTPTFSLCMLRRCLHQALATCLTLCGILATDQLLYARSGIHAAPVHAPSSLAGYKLTFDEANAQTHATGSAGMKFAVESKFAYYKSWEWQPIEHREFQQLISHELRFDKNKWYSDQWYSSPSSDVYKVERVSANQLFVTIVAERFGDGEHDCSREHLMLHFDTPRSGSAVWGSDNSFVGNISFQLSSVSNPSEGSQQTAINELPARPEHALFIIDDIALCLQHGKAYYNAHGKYEHFLEEPPSIIPDGSDRHGNPIYSDRYGSRWAICEQFAYSGNGREGLLSFSSILRHTYKLCLHAYESKNSHQHYTYGDAPALLKLRTVNDGIYHCEIHGYYGPSDMNTPPRRVKNARLIVYKSQPTPPATPAPPAATSRFEKLCRKAQKHPNMTNWNKLKAYRDEYPEELTQRQRELFPLAYFYTKNFRTASSEHYAQRLTELLPALLAGDSLNHRHNSGNTALHYAAAMGSGNLSRWLINNGASINVRNEDNQTPLDCLGVNKSGLDKWMIQRGAIRSHPISPAEAILLEYGTTHYLGTRPNPPTAKPHPPTPPPAAENGPVFDAAERLVNNFVSGLSTGNVDWILRCYDARVDYFDQGMRSKQHIKDDNAIFFRKYPVRHFKAQNIQLSRLKGNNYQVQFKAICNLTDAHKKKRNMTMLYTMNAQYREGSLHITKVRCKQI